MTIEPFSCFHLKVFLHFLSNYQERESESDTEGGMDIGRGGLKKDIVTDSERETERERKVDTHLET